MYYVIVFVIVILITVAHYANQLFFRSPKEIAPCCTIKTRVKIEYLKYRENCYVLQDDAITSLLFTDLPDSAVMCN